MTGDTGLAPGKMLFKNERGLKKVINRPEWANDPKLALTKEQIAKYNSTVFSVSERLGFGGRNFNADIVMKGEEDIIYQLNDIKFKNFSALLPEIVEAHFGSTSDFSVDYIPELKSWALLARNVRTKPLFNFDHFTGSFMEFLDNAIEEAR